MHHARLLCLVTLIACTPGRADEPVVPAPPSGASRRAPVPAAATATRADAGSPASCIAGDPFAPEALAATIRALASPELDGRVPGSAGDRTARTLIAERFACLGLTPAGDDNAFTQAFTAEGVGTANVIGFIRGADEVIGDEIILIGAHHDHLGDGHLGANDNASGVAALLAIAQEMRQRAPRRTIAFATWGAEEQGMLGSRYFVAHPPDALPLGKIVQYINLDMVGSHRSKGFVAAMGTFAKQPSRRLLATLERRYPKLRVGLGGRASRSDHTPFCARGIPYVFFWTPDARCYHEVCDTPVRIDLPRMADIAALAGDLAWSLAQSEADLAASRARLGCGQ